MPSSPRPWVHRSICCGTASSLRWPQKFLRESSIPRQPARARRRWLERGDAGARSVKTGHRLRAVCLGRSGCADCLATACDAPCRSRGPPRASSTSLSGRPVFSCSPRAREAGHARSTRTPWSLLVHGTTHKPTLADAPIWLDAIVNCRGVGRSICGRRAARSLCLSLGSRPLQCGGASICRDRGSDPSLGSAYILSSTPCYSCSRLGR